MGLWGVAELSTIWVIEQYAFVVVIYGLTLALVGREAFRRLWMAMLILLFTIPLPIFFSNSLSLHLELLSSALGVDVIRLFNIPVYLDGNVIDLGVYQLQVAEACSGLRYLFPLMTLAFIVAYFFRAPFWKRIVLFLASVPIAILMNSLRIGLIGVSVAYWGQKMAEGVLHYFEGWVVFMISTALLLVLAAALARFGRQPMRLRDAMVLDVGPPAAPASGAQRARTLPVPFLAATALTTVAALFATQVHQRTEVQPSRAVFVDFPMQLGGWEGRRAAMGAVYLNQLKLSDYLFATYQRQADSARQRLGGLLRLATQGRLDPLAGFLPAGWRVAVPDFRAVYARGRGRQPDRESCRDRAWRRARAHVLLVSAARARYHQRLPAQVVSPMGCGHSRPHRRGSGSALVPLPQGASPAEGDQQLTAFARDLVDALPRYVPN